MVSHPEPSRALSTIRRPPSVAGSSLSVSTVRRHHHRNSRSHVGGSSSYAPQNEFPCFTHTGDVEIIVTSAPGGPRREQRYLLHRLILAQCSGFFEAGTSEEWSRAQGEASGPSQASTALATIPTAAPNVPKKRWRYELDWGGPDSGEGETPMLVQRDATQNLIGNGSSQTPPRPPPVRSKPTAPSTGFFRSMANFSTLGIPQQVQQESVDDTIRDYDNLFRIFYNYPPALDPINIANAYVECKSLLQVADMYDALEVVGPRVDHHLLRFQSRLWKQIAKYPPSYLKLGYLARSRVIFTEALIHVVGQWPAGATQLRGQIPQPVIDLIEDKVDEIEELKQKIEGKLFRLTLTTSRGDRVTPANGWLEWMAMSLFRQWLAENTTPAPAPILKTPQQTSRPSNPATASRLGSAQTQVPPPPPTANSGRVFRLLGAGGNAYLNHEDLKKFLKINPEFYTRDSLKRFERRMDELKNLAKDTVKPLMRNFLELDLQRDTAGAGGTGGLPYLTCTRLEERDFPWED